MLSTLDNEILEIDNNSTTLRNLKIKQETKVNFYHMNPFLDK